ncbi:unnamed protein product (plasmid) [Mycetohabitans rhizoxinica HKI 454]|uniref:Uncharacterized protein n=1 Tax=Mycetohabitans rhizoxinica (strain DSM 19002 / CIP 109453 / HKI 454) TaxID=882378 RepID=E5AVR2_MYCRK|nr:unnamed protein product [Mycetohabitans rhizoxinica HKI 454]
MRAAPPHRLPGTGPPCGTCPRSICYIESRVRRDYGPAHAAHTKMMICCSRDAGRRLVLAL